MMPKLVFLGTGAAVPSKDDVRHETATWLSYGKNCIILVDCGEGTKYNLLRAGLGRRVHHIFLTHDHFDHMMGLTGLLAMISLGVSNPPGLTLYGPQVVLDRAKVLVEMVRSKPGAQLGMKVDCELLDAGVAVDLGPVRVTSFATEHREKMSLGYVFTQISGQDNKIAFLGDTRYIPSLIDAVRGSAWLIANANFAEDKADVAAERGHMTVVQAAQLAQTAGVERLFLQHLSPRYAKRRHEVLFEARRVFPETYLADDLQDVS
jgi:ribonuclease Z